MKRRALGNSLFLCLLVAACGCGKKGPVPVEGQVTLDGQPLAAVTLTFTPVDAGGPAYPAVALSDREGNFQLTTTGGAGAHPGKYRVLVSKGAPLPPGTPGALITTEGPPDFSGAAYGKVMSQLAKKDPASDIPPIYSDPAASPLVVEVTPAGDKEMKVQLSRAVKGGTK